MNRSIAKLVYFAIPWLLLATSGVASAGTYTVVYSGGAYSSSPGGGGNYGANGVGGWGASADPSGNSASASCSGQVTATFTWNPNNTFDNAPASAIVVETCSARAYGQGYLTRPSASAADGLGDPELGTPIGTTVTYRALGRATAFTLAIPLALLARRQPRLLAATRA